MSKTTYGKNSFGAIIPFKHDKYEPLSNTRFTGRALNSSEKFEAHKVNGLGLLMT